MTHQSQRKKALEVINKKVDVITKLVAVRAIKGMPPERSIVQLYLFDFTQKDIALITQRTTKEVKEILDEWRKSKF